MGPLDRIRAICLALPEAFEVEAWGHATFRVGRAPGKIFCIAAEDGARMSLKAEPLEREALLAQGGAYYVPPYVGGKGWLGVEIGRKATWDEIAELIATSYCLTAPKRLAAQVTEPPPA